MRIACFSDVHGNIWALEAVLADIEKQKVDLLVCGGDLVNPFLKTKEIWEIIKQRKIATVRGNHEDYLYYYFYPEQNNSVRKKAQFEPVRIVAEHAGKQLVDELSMLPLSLAISGEKAHDIYFCHASPLSNKKTYMFGIDDEMASSIRNVREKTILAGHIHQPWHQIWEDKLLIVAGSVGVPLHGAPEAQYIVLTQKNNSWQIEPHYITYDYQSALNEFVLSGMLSRGGPIAWLLYIEIKTGSRQLSKFLEDAKQKSLKDFDADTLKTKITKYLIKFGYWEEIKAKL